MDQESSSNLLEDYAQSLSELTFNSGPIIENLTAIAKESPAYADGIINIITARIYKAIPAQKLYSLYLLDSICKTVGNPYNILVGEEIFSLFSHVFQLGSESTRQTLASKLFESWKVAKTKGTNYPLFPQEQLDKIKTFLDRAGYPKSATRKAPSPELSNKTLIEDINGLIPLFQKKLQSNSSDPKLQDRFNALKQLKMLLSSQTMKTAELQAVQAQLNTIKEQELNTPMPTPATTPATTPGPQNRSIVQTPKAATPQPPAMPDADKLFHGLVISGLVKVDQEPIPGSKPVYSVVFPKIKYVVPKNGDLPSNSALQDILTANINSSIHRSEYEKIKFGELLIVSKQIATDLQGFLNNNTPSQGELNLLYEAKSSKCSLCGKRFGTDTEGAAKKRLHLDWHYRINNKLASRSNVQSRNWYLDDYDWANFKDEALLEFSTPDTNNGGDAKDVNAQAKNSKVAYVLVPPNDTNMNNRCVICRESIKATYDNSLGEWCWYNCVTAPGESSTSRKIMHATCAQESRKKRGPDDEGGQRPKREKT
ncbi:pre-mRNA cleavage and polyadenylation factor I subunit [Scheffersomyces xylosifermentans]|uniref:pre-mRNA cleavage and polyadenylation factor I subunit n=1 Tax=Scheffersomyces xylosifermentans TaxID=1304137 RepID=UPI00315CB05B